MRWSKQRIYRYDKTKIPNNEINSIILHLYENPSEEERISHYDIDEAEIPNNEINSIMLDRYKTPSEKENLNTPDVEIEIGLQQLAHEFRRKKLYIFVKTSIGLRRQLGLIATTELKRKLMGGSFRIWREAYLLEEFSKITFVVTWHRTKMQRRILREWLMLTHKIPANSFHIVR
jgi:hypothetical protein